MVPVRDRPGLDNFNAVCRQMEELRDEFDHLRMEYRNDQRLLRWLEAQQVEVRRLLDSYPQQQRNVAAMRDEQFIVQQNNHRHEDLIVRMMT